MNFKHSVIIILILIIIVFLLFFPIYTEICNNVTIYHSIVDLGVADYSFTAALIVGLLSFLTSIYINEENLKIMMLSPRSDEYLSLLIGLENIFLFYNLDLHSKDFDTLKIFTEILILWKKYQKTFRLIYPKSYNELMNFFTKNINNTNKKNYEINAEWLILDVKTYILCKSDEKNEHNFKLKKTSYFTDEAKFSDFEGEIDCEITISSLESYFNEIPGENTKKITLDKFSEVLEFINTFINELENETTNQGHKIF